ncbi:MAG TPA: hypothetical protein PKC18_11390, partial [Lacipirellulaceae bacterium]|nr:hypothetical protein [Lacipirellulaceae bacterium]
FTLADADFAREFGLDSPPPAADPAAPVVADPTPTYVPPAEPTLEATDDDPDGEELTGEEGEGEGEGEEASAAPTPTPEKPAAKAPVVPFRLFDKEGDFDLPAELMVEVKRNGKLVEKPLSAVLRAYQGLPEQEPAAPAPELEQEVATLREHVEHATTEAQRIATELREQKLLNRRLLADAAFRESAVEKYEEENTPERQLARLQEENRQLRAKEANERTLAARHAWFENQLAPAIAEVLETYPVDHEALMGRLQLHAEAQGWRRNGAVDARHFDQVLRYVRNALATWAKSKHEASTAGTRQVQEAAQTAVRRAKEESTRTKRLLSRRTAPGTVAAPTAGGAPPKSPRPVRTADDAVDSLVEEAFAAG